MVLRPSPIVRAVGFGGGPDGDEICGRVAVLNTVLGQVVRVLMAKSIASGIYVRDTGVMGNNRFTTNGIKFVPGQPPDGDANDVVMCFCDLVNETQHTGSNSYTFDCGEVETASGTKLIASRTARGQQKPCIGPTLTQKRWRGVQLIRRRTIIRAGAR